MSSSDRPFSGLLAELQRSRFPIGVDHHVRIARLLEGLGGTCEPERLKTLLCPLIATSAEEQKRFYEIFDRYYAPRNAAAGPDSYDPQGSAGPPEVHDPQRPEVPWPQIAAAVVLLGVIGINSGVRDWTDNPAIPSGCDSALAAGAAATDSCPDISRSNPLPDSGSGQVPAGETAMVLAVTVPPPDWYQRYYPAIAGGAVGVPFILVGVVEWLRRRRRRTRRDPAEPRPPYHWTIRAPPAPPWYRGEDFAQAVRLLRMREEAGHLRLDVERSIVATVEEGGYPTWRFRSDTRPPEYLFLIDRAGQRDHQARHYASLVRGLDDEDLFVEQWFFDRDPRICTTDSTTPSTSLSDLARRRSGSRLVVFADGESLVDPISGELAGWTRELEAWPNRAILTPRPPSGWGEMEIRSLDERLLVRPGTLHGLKAVGYDFATDTGQDRRDWAHRQSDTEAPPVASPDDLDELRATLDPEVYRWLCACAVYPELHWDLTLELGRRLGGKRLLTERSLLALARLPWFRAGAIPDRIRARLIADLEPEVRRMLHGALAELLERDPPDKHSFAAQRHAENLALQRLGAAANHHERDALRRQLQALAPERLFHEAAVAGLEPELPRSRVGRHLPRRWWGSLYEEGDALYGLRPGLRLGGYATLAACLALLAWWLLPAPRPQIPSFRFEPDSITLALGGPGVRVSTTGDSPGDIAMAIEDTSIGRLDRAGLLLPRAPGRTRLLAYRAGDTTSARVGVVDDAPAEQLVIVPRAINLAPGDSLPLDLENPPTRAIISWRTEDSTVAAVSRAGLLRAIGPGRTTVLARRGRQTGVAPVTVALVAPPAIRIVPGEATLRVGDTIRLRPVPIDGKAEVPDLKWSSTDPKVASVNARGVVRGEAPGRTGIVAAGSAGRTLVRVTVEPDTADYPGGDTSVTQQSPVQESAEQQPIEQQSVQQQPVEQQPVEQSQLVPASWVEEARRELRQRNSVSPLPVPSGVTVDIRQVGSKGPVYGYAPSARFDGQSPESAFLVQSERSPEFDLEVHLLGARDLRLVGFVTPQDAELLAEGERPDRLSLALSPSEGRTCLALAPFDEFVRSVAVTRRRGAGSVLVLTNVGQRMTRGAAPTVCYAPAARY